MQNKKSTSSRKLKICRDLLICSICITLSCVNVFDFLNLTVYANNQTETPAVEEAVEYEEREAADGKVTESALDEKVESAVIVEFDMPKIEVFVNIGTDKADIPLPGKLTVTSEGGEKAEILVTWDDGGFYDMDTEGAYTFTADIGGYTYDGERPIAVATVKADAEPLEEAEQQEQDETPIIGALFTLDQTPVIDGAILANSTNKVVVINGADSKQVGYSTLQAAMQAIGTNSGSYAAIFVQNYSLTTADRSAVTANGANAQLTITSTYKDGFNTTFSRSILNSATWVCNSNTTFKDITFYTYLNIYANCNKLIIDTGVICGSISGSIYGGGSTSKTGNSNITILSGRWNSVYSGGSSGIMNGNATINIGGTAMITGSISAAAGVTGRVTVNVDGSDEGTVQSFAENTASDEFNINLYNATITGNLYLGNANLNVFDECIVGNSITAGTTAEITIKLSDGASLTSNGSTGSFNCPKANIVFGAGSKLICKGTTNKIGNIVTEGDGARLNVKKGNPMTVSGTRIGENKLNVDFINNTTPALFDIFLTFATNTNANKGSYTYPRTNGYDGIVTVNGNVVYYDFVPPEGYVYDWHGTTSLYVGGHDVTQNIDDLKCQFGLKTSMDQDAFRLWSGQLTAKVNGYMNGTAFANYYMDDSPDFKYTIKVGSVVYYLTGNSTGTNKVTPSAVFRGYKKSADGSNLDLVFYLGRDIGIVYLHLMINPKSTVMSESWDYVNLSDSAQDIIMSHGGNITYAGNDKSYCISSLGKDIAFAFQDPSNPVMFMWVDQFTTANPAVTGKYPGVSTAVNAGALFEDSIAQTVVSGASIDTEMGIQWKYRVAAGDTQSASGGTAFGSLGSLQFYGKDVTFINPDKEDTSKAISHSVVNVSNTKIIVTKDDWSIEGLPAGITVTGISDSLAVPVANTVGFDLRYSVNSSVLPGTYPVHYMITNGTETYTFSDNITVIRDEVKITAEVKNEDNTKNTTAISGIAAAGTSPVSGATIYKYYNGRLSWTLDSLNYEIKKITVGGTELTATELVWAKGNSYLTFDEMTENKDVVIYVGEPSEEPTNKVTVSKTAAGGPGGQSFAFAISVKNEDGAALAGGTELSCIGSIIGGSGATAPTMTILTLDANGQAAFNLANGQILEIADIPAEGKMQVIEAALSNYEATHTVNGTPSAATDQKDTGLLDMGSADKVIVFNNIHLDDLTVSKTVDGEFGDKTKEFNFNISVKDKDGNNVTKDFSYEGGVLTGSAYIGATAPANGTLSISDGAGSFVLSHGQTITIKYIDPTYKIQVTEADPGLSYNTKYVKEGVQTDSREVSEFTLGGQNVTINYTNTRDSIPATGILDGSHMWIPIFGVLLVWCGILGFVMHRRRKVR